MISKHVLVAVRLVERQAFPKHRGTRPTLGGSRQQVTTEQTHEQHRERFYFPRSRFLSFFLYLSVSPPFSFTFVAVDQPVVRRRQSIYRSSTETRRYIGRVGTRESRNTNVYTYIGEGTEGRERIRCLTWVVVGHGHPFIRLSCPSKVCYR